MEEPKIYSKRDILVRLLPGMILSYLVGFVGLFAFIFFWLIK